MTGNKPTKTKITSQNFYTPVFKNFDHAKAWMAQKGKEYGGVKRFQCSQEFLAAQPQLKKIFSDARAEAKKKRDANLCSMSDLDNAGFKVGDKVFRVFVGAFLSQETRTGIVAIRAGKPIVKLDREMAVQTRSGKVSYRKTLPWDQNWTKA